MSKRSANQIIALFDEFGPSYFEVSQVTRISPETYRAIQPAIRDGALHHQGRAIALIEANSQEVAAAVAEIRKEKQTPPASTVPERLSDIDKRFQGVVDDFRRVALVDRPIHRHLLENTVDRMRREVDRLRLAI
jgi:hypothetical protein